jgi:hypothetical protein
MAEGQRMTTAELVAKVMAGEHGDFVREAVGTGARSWHSWLNPSPIKVRLRMRRETDRQGGFRSARGRTASSSPVGWTCLELGRLPSSRPTSRRFERMAPTTQSPPRNAEGFQSTSGCYTANQGVAEVST